MAALVFDFDASLPRRLYWDASFLVHAVYPAGRYHRACYSFLDRLSNARETLSHLLPRDALHLTTMAHYGVDSIVTTDDDFLSVDRLRIYTCNSRILSQA